MSSRRERCSGPCGDSSDTKSPPPIGGNVSLVDGISVVRQLLHEANPCFYDIGQDDIQNGQYIDLYISGSGSDEIMQHTVRTGETIRTACARIEDFMARNPMEHASYRLAGGRIGVLAAVNDIILKSQIRSMALTLLVVVRFRGSPTG